MADDPHIEQDIEIVLRRLGNPERDALQRIVARAERDGECRAKARAPRPQPPVRKPRQRVADGLKTLAEGAAKLGCSLKTLKGHITSGALRYVAVGHGSKRQRKMLTDADLDAFITSQTRKDLPCPSSATRAHHIGATTSNSMVIAFSAAPRPPPSGKRKP